MRSPPAPLVLGPRVLWGTPPGPPVFALLFALCALCAPGAHADDEPAPVAPAPALPEASPPSTAPDPAEPDRTPAALEGEATPTPPPANTAPVSAPAATSPTSPSPSPSPSADATAVVPEKHERRVGDPIPLTRREPTLHALGFMVGVRYGLVGTGPTRFVDDVRFAVTDAIEVRTDLLPYPSSLMLRARFGSEQTSPYGALLVDAGLAHWDAGFRIVPDTGESAVGMRFHFEGGLGWAKAIGERFALTAQAHYRYRLSLLKDDNEHAVGVDGHVTYDLLDSLAVAGGLGIATTIGTPVRELSINFVETDGPGISHLLARDEGGQQSVTIPLSLTYGRVENFDVDLFCTPRVWPELGVLFGAGVRLRLDPFKG